MSAARLKQRRATWDRMAWHTSEHGSSFVNVRGFNVVVYSTRRGYGIKIEQRFGDKWHFGTERYHTRLAAQLAAFDDLLACEQRWGGNGRYDLTEGPRT